MEPGPLKSTRNRAFLLVLLFGALHLAVGTVMVLHRRHLAMVGPNASDGAEGGALPNSPNDGPVPQAYALSPTDGGAPAHRPIDPFHGRADRDALRERIYLAFGQPLPSEAEPAEDAAVAAAIPVFMPELDGGTIDPSYIQERVHDDLFPLAKECYGELLGRQPDAGGRLSIDFTIVGDPSVGGIVESAEINGDTTLGDKAMAECVRQSMLSLSFAPPPHGGKVTVVYPIDFAPGDDDGGN